MTPETAVSLALLKLYKETGQPSIGFREDLVRVLLTLRDAGISLGLGFKSTPEGVESDEVVGFVGRLAMGGYVVQESPIRLTSYGIKLLGAEISDHSSDPSVQQALGILGLTNSDVLGAQPA